MTMRSPGRAGSPEEGRRDGAPERPEVLLGVFVVACLRVTFFDVPVLSVALLEAVLLTVVFFAVAFLALALLAVVLFVGTFFRLPCRGLPAAYDFDMREADRPGRDRPQAGVPVRRPEGGWRFT